MKTTENITNITNNLRYIWLLPEDEQLIEINNMIQYLKNINKMTVGIELTIEN